MARHKVGSVLDITLPIWDPPVGGPFLENVQAEVVDSRDPARVRLLVSPGAAQGFAAGDVLELGSEVRVIRRGGNLSVQMMTTAIDQLKRADAEIGKRLGELGGYLDGGTECSRVYTIPVTCGFAAIEKMMKESLVGLPRVEWMYGNVYDESGAPLNWWLSSS